MTIYVAGVMIAIAILALGERLPNETKSVYIDEGYDWNNVLIASNIAAFVSGCLAVFILSNNSMPEFYNSYLLPAAITITTYITVQSLLTDLRIFLINRNILRVSYVTMYLGGIYNVLSSEQLHYNWISLAIFTVLLVFLFIFSSIGASDVRAIAVALPYTLSMGGYDVIYLFALTLLAVALYMMIRNWWLMRDDYKRYKLENEEYYNSLPSLNIGTQSMSSIRGSIRERYIFRMIAKKGIKSEFKKSERGKLAVGPFMIIPFLIYLFAIPFIA